MKRAFSSDSPTINDSSILGLHVLMNLSIGEDLVYGGQSQTLLDDNGRMGE